MKNSNSVSIQDTRSYAHIPDWCVRRTEPPISGSVLYIDQWDYQSQRSGGTYAFTKQMLRVFGNRLALVGTCTNEFPVGRWIRRRINGQEFDFFGTHRLPFPHDPKPLVPYKVTGYLALRHFMSAIRKIGIRCVFTQLPEVMMAVSHYHWSSVCFRFTGVGNPVATSRYHWARVFGGTYKKRLFKSLKWADRILVTADDRAIEDAIQHSEGRLERSKIAAFPTRVDISVFKPIPKAQAREKVGIPVNWGPIVLFCGRLNCVKGWDLVLEAFARAVKERSELRLVFVGEGEDHGALEHLVEK